jgi:hypothetical protein
VKQAPPSAAIAHHVAEQGAPKKNITYLGSSGAKKVPGMVRFILRFFIMFLNSPHRETPKNVIKENREKIGFGFFCRLFCKNLTTRFFCKTFFCGVF